MVEAKWAKELSELREEQKREYHDWVHRVYEDTQTASTPPYVWATVYFNCPSCKLAREREREKLCSCSYIKTMCVRTHQYVLKCERARVCACVCALALSIWRIPDVLKLCTVVFLKSLDCFIQDTYHRSYSLRTDASTATTIISAIFKMTWFWELKQIKVFCEINRVFFRGYENAPAQTVICIFLFHLIFMQ